MDKTNNPKTISLAEHQERIDHILDFYAKKTGIKMSDTPIQDSLEEKELHEFYKRKLTNSFAVCKGFANIVSTQSLILARMYHKYQDTMERDELVYHTNALDSIQESLEYYQAIYEICLNDLLAIIDKTKQNKGGTP